MVLSTFSLLMFILPISGTIALRNVLVSILILTLAVDFFKKRYFFNLFKPNKDLLVTSIALATFLLYALLHSIYLSHEPTWSLNNFRGHLLYPTIYFFTGILLANFVFKSKTISKKSLITILFCSMFIHVLYMDLVAIDRLWSSGVITRRYGGLIQYITAANYMTNILLAMIISELVYRLRVKKKIMAFPDGVLYLLLAFCIVSTFVEALRLGDIALVFLGIGSATVFLYKNHEYSKSMRRVIAASLIVVLTIPLAYNIKMDPRWSKLIETVPMAIDTSSSQHWLDRSLPQPKTEGGHEVGGSNYERIAWAMKSLNFIIEDPIGIGYGKDAFGHALEKRYPQYTEKSYRGKNSHSAILSLAVGIGIPGVLLWFMFIYTISKKSIINFKESYNYFAIMTLFVIIGFFGRSFVDANMRDHVFQQYMIILGIGLFFMIKEKNIEHTQE